MARRRRTFSSSSCCSDLFPKNPSSFRPRLFVLCELLQIWRGCCSGKLLGGSSLSGGSVLFLALVRSFVVVDVFSLCSPCRIDRLFLVLPVFVVPAAFIPRDVLPLEASEIDVPVAVVIRRRCIASNMLGLGQFSRFLFWRILLIWAQPKFGSSEVCVGPLSELGSKLVFRYKQALLAGPFLVHQDSSSRFCSRTTCVGLDSALLWRCLPGFSSDVFLPMSLAVSSCSRPRTTLVGSNFQGSTDWCLVTSVFTAIFRIVLSAFVRDSISCNITLYVVNVVQSVFSLIRYVVIKGGLRDDDFSLSVRPALFYPSYVVNLCFCFDVGLGSLIALAPPSVIVPSPEDV